MKLRCGLAVLLSGLLSLAGRAFPVTIDANSITPPAAGSASAADLAQFVTALSAYWPSPNA